MPQDDKYWATNSSDRNLKFQMKMTYNKSSGSLNTAGDFIANMMSFDVGADACINNVLSIGAGMDIANECHSNSSPDIGITLPPATLGGPCQTDYSSQRPPGTLNGTGGCPDSQSLVCNTKSICEKNTWPWAPQSAYVEQNDEPKNSGHTNWTNNLEGIASDNEYWYITNEHSLMKVSLRTDLDGWGGYGSDGVGARTSNSGLHFGDLDTVLIGNSTYILVPFEPSGNSEPYHVGFYDSNLNYLGGANLPTGPHSPTGRHLGWLAYNAHDKMLYSDDQYDQVNYINAYRITLNPTGNPRITLAWDHDIRIKDANGNPTSIASIQGGAFSSSQVMFPPMTGNHLYVVSNDNSAGNDASPKNGVYGIDITTGKIRAFMWAMKINGLCKDPITNSDCGQEMEGITIMNSFTTPSLNSKLAGSGQIHVLMIDNNTIEGSDDLYFKHYSISDPNML